LTIDLFSNTLPTPPHISPAWTGTLDRLAPESWTGMAGIRKPFGMGGPTLLCAHLPCSGSTAARKL
jgi:hypothetical protein